MCEFEIPRKTGAPIEFSVPRMEYTSIEGNDKFDTWLQERMKSIPVVDDDGEPVLDDDGNPVMEQRETITDREVQLKMLECAGVTAAVLGKLAKLTNGELEQIWKAWNDASKVTVGEFDASETS